MTKDASGEGANALARGEEEEGRDNGNVVVTQCKSLRSSVVGSSGRPLVGKGKMMMSISSSVL